MEAAIFWAVEELSHSERPTERPTRRGRRTQQERRDATREVLLGATVECLVELGYAATTTLEIERRAQVSRGARIHHYATKGALLAAAVDHLYQRISDHYAQAFGAAAPHESEALRFRRGLGLLWSIYASRDYVAVLELNTAARTDADLAERLRQVADRHRELAAIAADLYFPSLDQGLVGGLVDTIHATLMGLLMARNLECCEEREAAVLANMQTLVAVHLKE
jgi:AcrR family transcriptional regulator